MANNRILMFASSKRQSALPPSAAQPLPTKAVQSPALSRRIAAIWSGLVLLALAMPVRWEYGDDSFPLSNYPMFSRPRGREAAIVTVVGVDIDGRRRSLSPEELGGTPWVNLAGKRVRDAVLAGRAAALCREVAGRVAERSDVGPPELEVTTETFDVLEYTASDPSPLRRRVHARCRVPR